MTTVAPVSRVLNDSSLLIRLARPTRGRENRSIGWTKGEGRNTGESFIRRVKVEGYFIRKLEKKTRKGKERV